MGTCPVWGFPTQERWCYTGASAAEGHEVRGSWICCPVGEGGGMHQVQPGQEKALQALGSSRLILRRLWRWWSPALHNGELKEGERGHKTKQERFRTERRKVFTMKTVSSQTGCSEWLCSLHSQIFKTRLAVWELEVLSSLVWFHSWPCLEQAGRKTSWDPFHF